MLNLLVSAPNLLCLGFPHTENSEKLGRGPRNEAMCACIYLFVILFFFCRLDPLLVHQPISGAEQTCITFAADTEVALYPDWEQAYTKVHHCIILL